MQQSNSYIAILGYTFQAKNDLEKDIAYLLAHENRRVITAKDTPDYMEQLLEQIRILNGVHSKLPPVDAEFHNPGIPCLAVDYALSFGKGSMICNFTLYAF